MDRTAFGGRFKAALSRRGLRLKDVHEQTGVAAANLSMYASGKVEPRISTVEDIAAALVTHPATLIWGVPVTDSQIKIFLAARAVKQRRNKKSRGA